MKAPSRPLIKTCAVVWTISVFICYVITGVIGLIRLSNAQSSYLAVFLPAAGITAATSARAMAGKLGLDDLKDNMVRSTRIAAALGFLAVGLILQFALGWEVGKPVYGSHSMPTILEWCCFGSALVGGMVIGWTLSNNQDKIKMHAE
jgi:hypothetical protein